jgi:23S rRNA G2069 N7-methylase RlmK/C1962 C5-methylase RlmI
MAAPKGFAPRPTTAYDPARIPGQQAMLANRLRKRLSVLVRWAKRESVSCYRVYDADIPELPLAIDRYEDRALVAVYQSPVERPPAWLEAMCDTVAIELGVRREWVYERSRSVQAGGGQYTKLGDSGDRFVAHEGGARFWVNLADYLDTGLFLDHRPLRLKVRAEASGKDVLNLFAYTGAFTVHAAAGGAKTTTSVDTSQTYLDWARDNLRENNLYTNDIQHALVRADVMTWLAERAGARAAPAWDLAIVDPPTFSNTKGRAEVFDVQRDHVALLDRVFAQTRPGGTVYFSTNFRRFKPAFEALAMSASIRVTDITRVTIPFDFRDDKIHRAWRLERAAGGA